MSICTTFILTVTVQYKKYCTVYCVHIRNSYPIQKYNFAVKNKLPRKCKLLNDWKVWYHCEAKNSTRLHTILARKPAWLSLYIWCKLQVFVIELVTFAVDFVPLAVEFGTFVVEFVNFAVKFVALALQFITLAMELDAFAMELSAFALESLIFALEFVIASWSKHKNKM